MAVVTIATAVIAYQYTYWREHQLSDSMGLTAAEACASMLEIAGEDVLSDPNSQEYKDCRDAMRELCRDNHMDYMYAYRCDVKAGTITYLFCVADDDRNDAYIGRERAFGTVVQTEFSEQELQAIYEHEAHEALVLDNQFGQMLAWFCKVDGWSGNVLAGADYSISEQRSRVIRTTVQVIALLAITFLALLFVKLYVLRKHVFNPIRIIADRMKAFSAEKAGDFEPLGIDTNDEMGEIAEAFTGMAGEIDTYVHDIERMTSERVQASVEMDVARRIQLGMVPERTSVTQSGVSACALALTAREVGGDFYDCLVIDDGRVALVIGDVSGKGVAASLFMVMAKTMIHDSLVSGESPAAALNKVNDRLCQSNPEGMFVTVFAALYDPVTGTVKFANAGHMPPLLVNSDVRVLDTDPGVLLGLFEDAGIEECTTCLSEGETLLLYTDGVTEAVNPANEFFGEERFMAALQTHAPYATAQSLIAEAARAIDTFVESREQFDDFTLLALTHTSALTELPVNIASFSAVRESIMATRCSESLKLKACLACEEALANVVSYSNANHMWLDVSEDDGGALRIVLADDGSPFDPTSAVLAEKEFESLDSGGMGIGLVRQLASDLHYRREADRNILVIVMTSDTA